MPVSSSSRRSPKNRFILRYDSTALGIDPIFNNNAVVIYKNIENTFVVKSGSYIMDEIRVFDIRGRLLLDMENINASETSFNIGFTNEVLLVQITTDEGIKVIKKVIK